MRRNKPNHKKTKNLNHYARDVRDTYLPRTKTLLGILDNFDEVENARRRENADQVQDLTDEEDSTKDKKYKLLPEAATVSSLPSNESLFYDICSSRGISEDKDSSFSSNLEEAECEITSTEWNACSSDMETVLPKGRKQISRSKRTENGAIESEIKSRTLFDGKESMHYSNDSVRTRINKEIHQTFASLPLVQTPRHEKAASLSDNKKVSKGRKPGPKRYEPDIGIVNGKKLSNSIAPEYHNLRPFLPLLTLCQCPDYDSAVIEVVRDYNDPCRGVASHFYPPSNPY